MTQQEIPWRILCVVTPRQFAEAIYHLNFANREFANLPEHVQVSYCQDAVKLLKYFNAKPARE